MSEQRQRLQNTPDLGHVVGAGRRDAGTVGGPGERVDGERLIERVGSAGLRVPHMHVYVLRPSRPYVHVPCDRAHLTGGSDIFPVGRPRDGIEPAAFMFAVLE